MKKLVGALLIFASFQAFAQDLKVSTNFDLKVDPIGFVTPMDPSRKCKVTLDYHETNHSFKKGEVWKWVEQYLASDAGGRSKADRTNGLGAMFAKAYSFKFKSVKTNEIMIIAVPTPAQGNVYTSFNTCIQNLFE